MTPELRDAVTRMLADLVRVRFNGPPRSVEVEYDNEIAARIDAAIEAAGTADDREEPDNPLGYRTLAREALLRSPKVRS